MEDISRMRKTLKRAMIFSLIMIVASMTMLFTTTYAWFVDSQNVDDNTITSGTLDVVMTAKTANGTVIDLSSAKIINEVNWEPSDWNAVAITITNNGTLDFKYNLNLVLENTNPLVDLSPVIWYVLTSSVAPTAIAPYTVLAEPVAPVFMDEFTNVTGLTLLAGQSITYRLDYGFLQEAGNEYQGGQFLANITVQAYQTMAS